MPSAAYFTASAPFWDFIERLESMTDEGGDASGVPRRPHPRYREGRRHGGRRGEEGSSAGAERAAPAQEGESASQEPQEQEQKQEQPEQQQQQQQSDSEGRRRCGGRRGFGGGCRRGGFRGAEQSHPHPHPYHGPWTWGPGGPHGGPHGGPRGPHGPHGHHGHRGHHGHDPRGFNLPDFMSSFNPFNGVRGFPFGGLARDNNAREDFKPAADLFTSPEAYTVHLSLPGAKREDIAVVYDPAKSELAVTGIVHRAGDEEFLATLSSGFRERDSETGVFERRIRFGNRRWRADVNENAIAAKLEDGVLVIVVPRIARDANEGKRSVAVDTEEEEEVKDAEKQALAEAERKHPEEFQHRNAPGGADDMDIETETEKGDTDVDGETLYDEKRKSVAFEEIEEGEADEDEDDDDGSDEDFVDVKRVDVQ